MDLDITAEELLAQSDLENILTYHVVSENVLVVDLIDGMDAIDTVLVPSDFSLQKVVVD